MGSSGKKGQKRITTVGEAWAEALGTRPRSGKSVDTKGDTGEKDEARVKGQGPSLA